MRRFYLISGVLLSVGLIPGIGAAGTEPAKPQGPATGPGPLPNIVYILADDLGYGDVRRLNPEGKIETPNIDRIAVEGMTFTDAHSSSSVCTPTRYGILTGRYNWRSPLKSGVLHGYSRRLIEPDRMTVPAILKTHGYHTACIGKWHLGMDWPLKDKPGEFARNERDAWNVDYAQPIANGPLTLGFDTYFGISASLDMPPFLFIENDHAQGFPTVEKTWIRKGPACADFEAVDVLPTLTARAVSEIEQRARAEGPFFLYLPLTAPHTPIVPTDQWKDQSGLNAYADFVKQVDASVGRVLDALDQQGLSGNTLVFFTSDNGCSPSANFAELKTKGHNPSARFRGHKADIFEGGHRIPFLARWPGHVAPGSISDQLICLTDLMATCAEILGTTLHETTGEDSVSFLPRFWVRRTGRFARRSSTTRSTARSRSAKTTGSSSSAPVPGAGARHAPVATM